MRLVIPLALLQVLVRRVYATNDTQPTRQEVLQRLQTWQKINTQLDTWQCALTTLKRYTTDVEGYYFAAYQVLNTSRGKEEDEVVVETQHNFDLSLPSPHRMLCDPEDKDCHHVVRMLVGIQDRPTLSIPSSASSISGDDVGTIRLAAVVVVGLLIITVTR